ncbi:MAG TPA: AbrB/MazE/SpoVT family DNA-binding domain-containing protein [Candidatus Methanomethylophilaceae archaeon]|nr:AbrB/MazE/SpoVT family DNA-binding domain-containing protein [Candidatus Methanomethylophilaceae archaeon]
MDIRRIQITGGSSFMVTLPKDWADSVGLQKNDSVSLQPQPDGSITIYPQGVQKSAERTVKTIDVDLINDRQYLYRLLVGSYIAGHSAIELKSSGQISSLVAGVASAFTQTAIGLEIMDESENRILIKDLVDQSEMRPSKSLERMRVLIKNLLSDILNDAEARKKNLYEGLVEKDKEIDRIDWLISRQVNIFQKEISLASKIGSNLSEITRSSMASRALERIGDHALMIAKNLDVLIAEPATSDIIAEVVSIGREANDRVSSAVINLQNKEMMLANKCINDSELLVERIEVFSRNSAMLDQNASVAASVISGSLRRIAEYAMDLSELAINAALY